MSDLMLIVILVTSISTTIIAVFKNIKKCNSCCFSCSQAASPRVEEAKPVAFFPTDSKEMVKRTYTI